MSWSYKDGFTAGKQAGTVTQSARAIESERITAVATAPAPRLTVAKIALAVFLGNLLTAAVFGFVYWIATAK